MSIIGNELGEAGNLLAIDGGAPARSAPIEPLYHVSGKTKERIASIVEGGRFSDWYGGPVCREFEREYASAFGANHAVAVNSGTSALHAAVVAAGIGPGHEVIVPAAAYVSAASVVVQERAIPVMCDIDETTYSIGSREVERRLSAKTRAIIPVHFWGCPVDMARISEIARRHNLIVIEDCAQSHGSTIGRQMTGSIGDFGCFSFAPRKHITTGQGGMVLCKSERHAIRVRELVNKGKGDGWLAYKTLGFSYAMEEVAAAVGLDGLKQLGAAVAERRAAADKYREVLSSTPLQIPGDPPWGTHVYFKVPILLPPEMADERDFMVDAILAENVSCRPPHPPMYLIGWLREYAAAMGQPYDPASFPMTGSLLPRILEVECGPNLTEGDVEVSAQAVLKVWNHVCRKRRAC